MATGIKNGKEAAVHNNARAAEVESSVALELVEGLEGAGEEA